MLSARTRISESNFLLAALIAAVVVATPRLAQGVNEFPDPAPKRPSTAQTSPTNSVQINQTQRMYVPDVRALRAPDLVGTDVRSARAGLQNIGLRTGREIARQTTDNRPGTVLAQDPKPGTPVKPGDAITLWIAAVPPGTQDGPSTSDGRVPPPRQSVIVQPPAIAVPPKLPRPAVVPDLITQRAQQVPALLQTANLVLGETQLAESEAPAGTVTSQVPAPGTRVLPGAKVNITVAKPVLVAVPDVTGRSSQDAGGLLARSKLALGDRRTQPSEAQAGTILSQFPSAGTRVALGTRVNVVIAVTDLVLVPNVIGGTWEDARRALAESRLGVGERRRRESEARAGTVLGQAPAAGTRVRPGTPVDLVLAVAAPARPPSVSVTPPAQPPATPPPAPAPGPVAQPPITPTPPVLGPVTPSPVTPRPDPRPVARPPITPTPPPPAVAAPPPSRPALPWSPNYLHYGVASALLLGAAASVMYYRARSTRGVRRQPVTSLKLNFVPRWDAGRQQIGPAGPLRSGSGLRLISRLETSTASLEADHLVSATHDDGGFRR